MKMWPFASVVSGLPVMAVPSLVTLNFAPANAASPLVLVLLIWKAPQLLTSGVDTGATKSLISAGNDAEERLFRNVVAEPNWHEFPDPPDPLMTPAAVRSIDASPNVPPARFRGLFGGTLSETVALLTAPSEIGGDAPFRVF